MTDINVGDLVRSFDFDGRDVTGERACYYEGIVEGFNTENFECRRYVIRVLSRVFSGKDADSRGRFIYPPVNGIEKSFGGVTDGVVLIDITTSYELVATGDNS